MRFRSYFVLGTALLTSGIAGCGVVRHPTGDSESWSWQQDGSTASRLTPQSQYGLSASPNRLNPTWKTDKASTESQFQFSHPRVDSFVTRFQTSLRGFFSGALSRSGRYVPRMSSILQKEGLPIELAYLPLIESGYRLHAVSRAGAVGPWQLIPGTGRRYGLRIDRFVDERRDPVKSTRAAAKYLKDLHAMFGDWHLSLAAYNTGEGNISRILGEGHADDFWEMSDRGYLYRETEDFVPEFLAALHIAATPQAYGFETPDQETLEYDLVTIKRSLPLTRVAKLSGASTEAIKELNPALHRGVTPPNRYAVRLPRGTKDTFEIAYANMGTLSVPSGHKKAVRHGRKVGKGKPQGHGAGRHVFAAIGKQQHNLSGKVLRKANSTRGARNLRAGRSQHVAPVAQRPVAPILAARHRGHSRVLD